MKKVVAIGGALVLCVWGWVGAVVASENDHDRPNVQVSPAYYDFGIVYPGEMRTTYIHFVNYSNERVPYFNVYCNGDMSVFSCSSFCYSLAPYGSCSVMVSFQPRNGDNFRKWVSVQGTGSGVFAVSNVHGYDAKPPQPLVDPDPQTAD